ncbi:MAG: 50S ribosomal protein L23 [Bacteroidota bacterium]|nr:50S ribosomal protein L23 [Bacteroidota bacterium]MDP4230651.1 50S ribosomal protein L23 [Bacteroidota bacterium]MDP4237532.1 50S ribosomal protein L23 [Bacteroidota bacterium]
MEQAILRRPLLTEKATLLGEKGIYTFEVSPEANKIQIGAAIESQFDVKVLDVRTLWMPLRRRSQFTRKGVLRGTKSRRKKAIVTLKPGFAIDLFTPMETKEKSEL